MDIQQHWLSATLPLVVVATGALGLSLVRRSLWQKNQTVEAPNSADPPTMVLAEPDADLAIDQAIAFSQPAPELVQQQFEQQRLVMEMSQRIRRSLNLHDILQTTVDEVRQFLQTDRVIIFQFLPDWHGIVAVESCGADWVAILSTKIHDPCFAKDYIEPFCQGTVTAKSDIDAAGISPCHLQLLRNFQVRANLVVPIMQDDRLWGLLIAHHCAAPRQWQNSEIELLRQIASQAGIALQQAALLAQVQSELAERKQAEAALQHLNLELEERVADRTAALTTVNERVLISLLELQQAQQETEDLYNNAPCGYHSLDVDGTIVRINHTELKWSGYSRDEVLHKKKFVDLLTPSSQQVFDESFSQLLQQGWINNVEFQLLNQDGSTRWVSLSSTAITDAAGQFVMSRTTLFDISDRKQTENALQQQTRQEQLRWNITQAIRQSLNLNAILDTAVAELRQTLQGDRVAVYRFQPDWSGDFIAESVSPGWVNLVDPGVQKIWTDTYLYDTQGGRFQNHETFVIPDIYAAGLQPCHIDLLEQFQAKAYAVVPIFSSNTLWGLLAIYQNATPRHWQPWEMELLQQIASQLSIAIQQSELYSQLQIELKERQQSTAVIHEAERRWRSLLDHVQLIVVGLDQTGTVNYVNPFFLRLTGYTDSETLGKNWFENFLPPSTQESIQTLLSEVLGQNTHPYYQNSILTKSGERRFIAWNNTMLQDAEGHMIGIISIGEDITERQKVEQMKNEFIGIVSHELRTPLTSIRGSLGLLATGVMDDEPVAMRRMIEIAATDTERLVRLVNDVLDLEKLESGKVSLLQEWCDAADLMQRSLAVMQSSAQAAGVQLVVQPLSKQIWVAPDRIIQTLTNLLSNAIKFSSAGKAVTLSAAIKRQALGIRDLQSSHIIFSVQDQGRGIPAEKLESIFGRFQQVDGSDSRDRGGTGLGLAICKSIVQQHGGQIWVESRWGQGSTFFCSLPLQMP